MIGLNSTLEKIHVYLRKKNLNAKNKTIFSSKLHTALGKHIIKAFKSEQFLEKTDNKTFEQNEFWIDQCRA